MKFLPKRKKVSLTNKTATINLSDKVKDELNSGQSYISLALGLLIVLAVGVLVFNFFKKNQPALGPATQTETEQLDVTPQNLPGKYTVKDGDTLFDIAQKYYNDGYKYLNIATVNKLENADVIAVGQVLEIPKDTEAVTITSGDNGIGGAINETIWGEKIEGDSYTVLEGDWLSKIAGRAYGDIQAFDKIAKANNITNPDNIEIGTVLKLPR